MNDEDDPLAAARGIVFGGLIGLAMWSVGFGLVLLALAVVK